MQRNLSQLEANPSAERTIPPWFPGALRTLCELVALPENWDSYGARPVDANLAIAAVKLLLEVVSEATPPPSVAPTNRGGILLEWHIRGIDLEVEILSVQRFHVAFEDSAGGTQWERELDPDELSPLVECLARLS